VPGSNMFLCFSCIIPRESIFILPQFTQTLMGYSAYQSGLTLLPRALTILAFMPLVGWLYNRIDAKILIIVGISVSCWSYALLAHISLEVAFLTLMPILFLMGAGMAFVFVPLSTVSLITIAKKDMTKATMLSYNDLSWIFMLMFLSVVIFILFLPNSRAFLKSARKVPLIT